MSLIKNKSMQFYKSVFYLSIICAFFSCDDDPSVNPSQDLVKISIDDTSVLEGNTEVNYLVFSVSLDKSSSSTVSVEYIAKNLTAIAGEDFKSANDVLTFSAGETQRNILVELIPDLIDESDEKVELLLFGAVNASIERSTAEGTIIDDEASDPIDDEGSSTPDSYPGLNLVWADEFDGTQLNPDDWYHETGAGGWGNNELQNYQSGTSNTTVSNGKLVIEAKKSGSNYTSARIVTRGKRSFEYGRIDIRAKLPYGQGIWTALWMLGESFTNVGWPACGEIDIMELVGHMPNTVYGTVHWQNQGSHADYGGNTQLPSGQFSDEFHVFTIKWDSQSIRWFLDDVQYHVIAIDGPELSEFQSNFFFIFNVAVGGNWPGNPDNSTVFPQKMIVDYVRVFQ